MTSDETMARRIADCLESHLEEYSVEFYRYPSGENKGVDLSVWSAPYGQTDIYLTVIEDKRECLYTVRVSK